MTAPKTSSIVDVLGELDASLPSKTPQGETWIRWAALAAGASPTHAGWYAIGTREPSFGARAGFWESVFLLAMHTVGNKTMDAAHAIGPSLLAIGGLGFTFASGYAQSLLGICLEAAPERIVATLAQLVRHAGVYPARTGTSPRRYVLHEVHGGGGMVGADLERAIRAGGDGRAWSTTGKALAFEWVSRMGFLRDDVFDRAQVDMCAEWLPLGLTDIVRAEIRWPRSAGRDAWQYTEEQKALWALALVLSIDDPAETERAILQARASLSLTPTNAAACLARMYEVRTDATYTERFRARLTVASDKLAELFQTTAIERTT